LRPIRERLQNFRVTVQSLADTLRACYDGTVASRYREGDDEHDIRVRLDESDRNDLSRLPDITAPNIAGQPVKLVDLAQQSPSTGPTQLKRKDRQRLVAVTANVSGTSPGEAHAAIVKKLANMHLPEGYRFTWGGDIEFMQENFRDLYSAMILAIVLTYLLLAGLLESWLLGLLIMLSLPLSFAGVYLALLITAKTTNIFSLMGMVMLIGLVINNAIVIVDYIEVLRQEGKPLREAIPEACAVRLRPILMATITALIAMLPLALGMGEGGEFRSPMAVAQMGGMAVGGFLALLITPALYVIARRRKEAKTA